MSLPIPHLLRRRSLLAASAALACALAVPGLAAASTKSANWSGYAIHGKHSHYTLVSGTWTVPTATCTAGEPSFSAVWVGIGGYRLRASALEQTGTETDCSQDGTAHSTAWFEVVPEPSRSARLTVSPGDQIRAIVSVARHHVTLTLDDLTSHQSFVKHLTVATVDTSSAEWIVEAPSECHSASSCTPLRLADFGSVDFTDAFVKTRHGQTGTITGSLWDTTEIVLHSLARERLSGFGTATPSALAPGGASFSVAYSQTTGPGGTGGAGGSTGPGPSSDGGGGGTPPGFPG